MRILLLILFAVFALACKTETPVNRSNINAGGTNSTVNKSSAVSENKNVNSSTSNKTGVPVYTYEVVNTYNHDPKAFTEGLFFHNGFLYESTG